MNKFNLGKVTKHIEQTQFNMAEKKPKSRILIYFSLILIMLFLLSFLVSFSKNIKQKPEEQEKINFIRTGNLTLVRMNIPAVDNDGKGVNTILNVKVSEGSGKTLVDIDNLLFWADTQQSIRIAKLVAENITKIDPDKFDLTYGIEANASVIGGPSAGAAITLATIFALNNEKPREDVMITGTINHDSSIGPVSGILEKAIASKEAGAKVFLVPLLQSRDVIYETKQHCEKFGFTEICSQETIPKKIDVASEAGIEVVEVGNIEEALTYFKNQ